ncbi:MAG: hypothetical protein RDV48_13315 [Candidatus Eremiobacteraeota bacterium]|nr:hypothetical protein [Candidatus Eremiobacteraeota bacterium]
MTFGDDRMDLLTFLRNLADYLAAGVKFEGSEIENSLHAVIENVLSIRAEYQNPSPPGTETIREFMLEALDLFESAIGEFFTFFEDGDVEHLRIGVMNAEEANDILSSIEYIIEQNKQWLSEFVAG